MLFHVSFDTSKAFDTALKTLVVAALMRLGVPHDVAQYLIDLDKNGRTVVKTQFAAEILRKYGMSATTLDGESSINVVLAFIAINGIGQGDATSSTIWKAIFDILFFGTEDLLSHTWRKAGGKRAVRLCRRFELTIW